MKYAENNRISHRQLYHQIILSFLAPLLICIPGYNGEQGLSGAVGIMAAVLILLLYVFFLIRTSYCYADPVKIMGKLKGSLLGIFFLIYIPHSRQQSPSLHTVAMALPATPHRNTTTKNRSPKMFKKALVTRKYNGVLLSPSARIVFARKL